MVTQKVAAQMPGATGGEAFLPIVGMSPGKAFRIVAPAYEPSGHHPDFRSLSKQAQHQIVVFWPGSIPIGILGQRFASDHERRMHDRTFDEAVAPEGVRIAE